MKRILSIPLMAALVLISLGQALVISQPAPTPNTPSGEIIGGFRVLEVAAAGREMNLTVYRGDYIKFKLADPKNETVLSIPAFSIEQRLSGTIDEAPYFKMERSGAFRFSLGAAQGLLNVVDYQQAHYREVASKDAAELIRNIAPLVLDVRTPGEYSKGHIKNSMLIDYLDDSFAERVSKLDKNKTVYVYCHSGGRSSEAQQEMQKQGFRNVINLEGGITAWEKAGLPVEK